VHYAHYGLAAIRELGQVKVQSQHRRYEYR